MAFGANPSLVIDCPDSAMLAAFYGEILGWRVEKSPGWADLRSDDGQCISFQQVQGYRPPDWPGQGRPQQMHLDIMVRDLAAAETEALKIGATKPEQQPGTTFRVFLDPVGHPFCLCTQ